MATTTETDQAKLADRANKGDAMSQFALNLQLDRDSGMGAEGSAGLSSLPMQKLQRRILPGVARSMDQVQTDLVDVFRALSTGKARWPLFLHGLVGTGKTAAALALCDFAASAYYITLDGLCDSVMGNGHEDAGTAWGKIRNKDLVVLDELAARERVGDLQLSTLQRVLDERAHHAAHRLICISNVSPNELGDILDDRCVSRLTRGTVFELTGPDRRRTERAEK